MSVTTLEGVVKDGRIVIPSGVELPEAARVYVVVPDMKDRKFRIASPRLVDPNKIKEFEREVIDINDDEIQQ